MRLELYIHGLFWKEIQVQREGLSNYYMVECYTLEENGYSRKGFNGDDFITDSVRVYQVYFELERNFKSNYMISRERRPDDYYNDNYCNSIDRRNGEEFLKGYCNDVHIYVDKEGNLASRKTDMDIERESLKKREEIVVERERGVFCRIKEYYKKEVKKGVYSFLDLDD